MPDIPNRDELEARMARLLGKLSKAQMGRLLEELGDPPRVENVSPTFWDEAGEELRNAIRPFMEAVYLESAQRLMSEQSVGVDWALVNEAAANWASTYTYELVTGINDTSARYLQSAVDRYYRDAQTVGELAAGLAQYEEFTRRAGRLFGVDRATVIAITETTRAAVEGERGIADELAKERIQMEDFWVTRNDEVVCTICAPRNGVAEGKGTGDAYWTKRDGPPAHPS